MYEFTDKTMGLNPGFFSNHDAFLNFRIGSYKTIIPNAATIEVYRFNNLYIRPERYIGNTDFERMGLFIFI